MCNWVTMSVIVGQVRVDKGKRARGRRAVIVVVGWGVLGGGGGLVVGGVGDKTHISSARSPKLGRRGNRNWHTECGAHSGDCFLTRTPSGPVAGLST